MKRFGIPLQLALFVGVGLALPLLPGTNFSLLITLLIFIGLATSWDILGGWTGQASLGHAAFVGIGAYALALGTSRLGMDAVSAVQLGMVVAVIFAFLWGSLTFGLRGSYFTLSTIAIAEILRLVAINEAWFTGGSAGLFISALPEPFGLDLFDRRVEYYLALLYATGVIGCVGWLSGSRFGYTMRAVREDEEAAQAAGIDPVRVKLRAFALSGALTALGGGIYGAFLSFLDPHNLFFLPALGADRVDGDYRRARNGVGTGARRDAADFGRRGFSQRVRRSEPADLRSPDPDRDLVRAARVGRRFRTLSGEETLCPRAVTCLAPRAVQAAAPTPSCRPSR